MFRGEVIGIRFSFNPTALINSLCFKSVRRVPPFQCSFFKMTMASLRGNILTCTIIVYLAQSLKNTWFSIGWDQVAPDLEPPCWPFDLCDILFISVFWQHLALSGLPVDMSIVMDMHHIQQHLIVACQLPCNTQSASNVRVPFTKYQRKDVYPLCWIDDTLIQSAKTHGNSFCNVLHTTTVLRTCLVRYVDTFASGDAYQKEGRNRIQRWHETEKSTWQWRSLYRYYEVAYACSQFLWVYEMPVRIQKHRVNEGLGRNDLRSFRRSPSSELALRR